MYHDILAKARWRAALGTCIILNKLYYVRFEEHNTKDFNGLCIHSFYGNFRINKS